MNTDERINLLHTALTRAGKMNTLALKVLLSSYLSEEAPLVHELAKEMKVTAPGVSRCLDNLEKAGLLTRVRENADRRQVRICFSAKGEKFIEKLVA